MHIESLKIPDLKLIRLKRVADARGYFCETYSARVLEKAGVTSVFVQDNESHSAKPGTVRGLHYQAPPFAQAKLVRVLAGAIRDIAVDARKGSPSYGGWESVMLRAGDNRQLFIPAGFLHGFATLEPDTVVAYKVDAFYDPVSDGAVRWDDPDLAIEWGVKPGSATVSEKDAAAQPWAEFKSPF